MRQTIRSGFSIVEICMVALMLGVCLLPFMGYFQNQTRQTGHTQGRSLGLAIAHQTMERFRNLGYDTLQTKCGNGLSEPDLVSDPLLKIDKLPSAVREKYVVDDYSRTIRFKEIQDPRVSATSSQGPGPRVGLLTVTVNWKPKSLPAASMQYSKIVIGHRW